MPRNQTLQLADNVSSSGSEQLHRIALDLVPIGLVYCALDGRFIYVNARMCEITGYAADELLGMTGTQLTHPDDLAHDKKLVHAFLSIGTPDYANEKRYVRKDGSSRWVAVTARMVTDDAGQPLHTVGAVRDIHDRKMAEAALREREAELSRAHRIAGIGSFKVEVRDGNFVADQSPEYLAVHGLTPQDRGNSHEAWLRRLHPEDREKADRTFRECLANGRKLYESEYRIIRQNDSATRWIRVLAEIERDASGAPLRLFGTHLDVTESRLHEAALRTSEIRYRRLFEAAHDGILILDPETRKIVDANPFMTTLIGYPYEQLIGLELFEIGFLADAQESRDMFEKLKATSQVRYENLPLQTKQGGPRDVEVVANLYDEGGHTVVQCNVRDITERKRIERVLRQHEERQAFLLKLSDTIRLLGDPLEIQTAALRVLGEHLAVSRAFYNEIDEERDTYVIHRTYANGVAPLIGHFRLSDIRRTAELAGSGQIVVFDDASADPRLSAAERAAFAAMEMAAGVGVPLIKDGRWVAGLGVHHATPRQWTPEEINLIHETAERTWAAVEQAQAETELQSGAARDVFRVRLTDALRGALTAEEAQETALHALGDHFQASRVMFGEGDEGSTETFTNRHEYCRAPAMPSSVGQHRWDAFGPYVETEFLAGRTLVVDDVQTHPDHSHQELAAYEMVGIKAYLAVPLVRQKRIIAYLAVNHTAMHTWTPDEIALAEETAERIWAAVERARTEAALAKSDNRFRMAISNSPITVFEQDLDLRYTWLYNAKLGFDDTLTLGKTDADLVDPAVAERLNAVKRRALETGQHSRQEVTVERPGHGVNHFDLSVEPRRGPDGQINGIIGTSIDITERKQTETALKASEHRYRTLIEGTSAVSWSCAPSGLQVEPQPQWMAFTGQSAAEMLGTGYARAFHPDDAEDATARWVDAVSRAEPYSSEHRIRRHDGEWRWMRVSSAPVHQNGGIAEWFGMAVDITERKKAETALRDSEERQAFLLKLSDAMRAEPSADASANRALRMLFDHMRLDRCYIGIYRLAEDRGDFPYQVHDVRLPPLPTHVSLSDFPNGLQIVINRTLVIDDVMEMEGLSSRDQSSIIGLGVRALINATLRKGENQPLWALIAASTGARVWTQSEVSLVEEVAERTWAALERARAETALRTAHDTFRSLVDRSPFGIYVIDCDFRLVQVSDGAQKVFENVRPLLGRDFAEVLSHIWPEPFLSGSIARFRHTLATGEPYYAESNESRADINATEAYDWKIERIMLPDGRFGVVCHFYDLSERIRHEEHVQLLMGEVNHRSKDIRQINRSDWPVQIWGGSCSSIQDGTHRH